MAAKRHHPYFIFLLASILLMTYQSQKGPLQPFRFINTALSHFDAALKNVGSSIEDTLRKITLKEAELMSLKARNDALRLQNEKAKNAVSENLRLKKLLAFKDRGGFVAAAEVIGKGGGRWASTLLIDKGTTHGVRKDMAVRTPDGLLGKIADSYPTSALVLLVEDVKFSAAVRLTGGRREAVASGAGAGMMTLKYVPSDEEVKEGERVITSGLDALFPKGIGVGTVSAVDKRTNELFQKITVKPFVDIRKVEEVTVFKR